MKTREEPKEGGGSWAYRTIHNFRARLNDGQKQKEMSACPGML